MGDSVGPPDTITITESHFRDLVSRGAVLRLQVDRTALTRRRGMQEPAPFKEFILALNEAGLGQPRIEQVSQSSLWGVVLFLLLVGAGAAQLLTGNFYISGGIAVAALLLRVAGLLDWPIMVRKWIRLNCPDSDGVSKVIDLVGEHGGVELTGIDWQYEPEASESQDWVDTCLTRARLRGERVAAALGSKLRGVHTYREHFVFPDTIQDTSSDVLSYEEEGAGLGRGKPSRRHGAAGPVLAFAGSERAGVTVQVQFKVEPVESEPTSDTRHGATISE